MSKRVFHHPEAPSDDSGVASWRSVGELESTPSFRAHVEREFPEGSGHLSEEDQKATRRSFMKLMGASSALSGLTLRDTSSKPHMRENVGLASFLK